MATKFADLSDKEKQNFAAQLKALGIDPATVPASVVADGRVHLHTNAALSNAPAQTVTVRNLAHLKELWGVKDTVFQKADSDAHINYPAPLADTRAKALTAGRKEAAEQAITTDEHQAVNSAVEAYVNGDSSKVPAHLVELADTLKFPMQVKVMAAQDLTITGEFRVSQAIVAGTITIQKGGFITVIGDASINAQTITVV